MKRFLLFGFCFLLLIANGAYAGIITLTTEDLVGTVTPSSPSDETQEVIFANKLIDMYMYGPSTAYITTNKLNTLTLNPSSDLPGTLPAIMDGSFRDASSPFTVDGSYLYLYAKFGAAGDEQEGRLFYLNGQMGEVTSESLGKGGLSHITLFNPVTVPEPSLIMLLGLGLGAIGLVSRRKK